VFRIVSGAAAGAAVFWILNAVFARTLSGALFYDELTRESNVAAFTLVVPAFLAGLAAGGIAPKSGLTVGLIAGAIPAAIRIFYADWRIASSSLAATHSAVFYYLTQNPITAVSFAALGGWLAGQFGTGRFTLTDTVPVRPEEDN